MKTGTELCDFGSNNGKRNTKTNECTVACTLFDPARPNCGNGKIDKDEDCTTCPIDFQGACIDYCGDGAINPLYEECDDGEMNNGRNGHCTFKCKLEKDPSKYC